jgi:hypothetical protein
MAAFGGAAMDPSAMSAMMSNPMMQQMVGIVPTSIYSS